MSSSVVTAAHYSPTFQGNNWVYRRVDKNGVANNRSANWVPQARAATNDQLVNNGGAPTIGDYRRGGFYNNRENKWIYMLNVDLQDLLAWNNTPGSPGFGQLFDSTNNSNGGTVIFLSVVGPNSAGINNYGVRVLDSPQLPGYPLNVANPLGITVASDQAFYVEGNYNSAAYAPTATGPTGIPWTHPSSALIGDTMNVLSQNWESTISGTYQRPKERDRLEQLDCSDTVQHDDLRRVRLRGRRPRHLDEQLQRWTAELPADA